jgi:hypothetical protein
MLAMQKVEGSNPFSRFREGLHLQVFLEGGLPRERSEGACLQALCEGSNR